MSNLNNKNLISLFIVGIALTGCSPKDEVSQPAERNTAAEFFDDFSYTNLQEFYANGWKARTETGHPGIAGATWSDEGISFHQDIEGTQYGAIRMTSVTDGSGENTRHTQFCHARKYLKGTYAARVFFRDTPTFGPDGDEVIQTFYAISPLKAPMDLDYSETDFEYLPNGGWGAGEEPAMWTTTWETFQLEPWTKVNENTRKPGSYAGWRTLVLHVYDDKVVYYVDGKLFSEHSEQVAPEVPMSMNFNLWFMPEGADGSNGPVDSPELRQYQEDIDWVYHRAEEILTTEQVIQQIAQFRNNKVTHRDRVPENNPPLPSPCGL
ncbi:glycoside hydrolase family 16 protein [Pseudoalteromonas sp. T1lg65]|uniref:glycoside hydrolase family 16 protein n=1 Tax=Pseudoalteromonas sp. T1lg65 TaxID=2077101 RepID=UPI003F7AAB9C